MSLATALSRVADQYDPVESEYLYDPVAWVEDRLREGVWSKQGDLMDAVADHRHTAVRSAHSTGKSHAASRLVGWWLDVHPPGDAFAITTAPTQPQVEAVLWREIGRAHSKGKLPGRITYGQVPMWKLGNEIVAYGRKPQDRVSTEEAMQAFQGIHAQFVLVILDEACGIPGWLWDAADTLASNENSRVLAIGNPDDPTSRFEHVCRPGSGWHRMKITAFDTPAFTGEPCGERLLNALVSPVWVEERKRRWGESSMLYTSKVLAEFPEVSEDTLITPAMVLRAQNLDIASVDIGKLGCDIARYGDDETVMYHNRGGRVRHIKSIPKADTMYITGQIARELQERGLQCPAIVDVIGVGAGVYDRLNEQGMPCQPFNAAEAASDPRRFHNLRAEQWWAVRTQMENDLVDLDPADEDLAAELLAVKYKIDSAGRIQIEPKEETKKRLGRSPDRADAVMMSCWERVIRKSSWRPL